MSVGLISIAAPGVRSLVFAPPLRRCVAAKEAHIHDANAARGPSAATPAAHLAHPSPVVSFPHPSTPPFPTWPAPAVDTLANSYPLTFGVLAGFLSFSSSGWKSCSRFQAAATGLASRPYPVVFTAPS
ncbi:hypothetical protein N7471_010334 [Penicillium samsonianum]|uniref:uncharacterized protein n=1 Tax=Penicillium samsonianum TaxID=1882272 RepID=UPI002548AB12|nr:uncharacterized protein N7471_010334 [Penicillium samsonianum]KAJ6125841.1 hypothetical protein N7471_010334 [Penicillium samsonianum]